MQRVKIWDSFVRLSHWLMVILIVLMWYTAEEGLMERHLQLAGLLGALVITRILWGFWGSESARFSRFVKGPKAVAEHLSEFKAGKYQPSNTHNAAGGWAVVALLILLLIQFGTGLFSSDDIFFSGPLASSVSSEVSELAGEVHETIFNVLAAVAILHIIAIVLYRIRGINLISAMFHGYREGVSEPKLVSGLVGIIAAAVIAAALFFWIN
ncbi:cytochrome b/b6 domain-containing protein [Pseudidiomarina marina]|uniref:Cytochrome B n=1 Tax=Pseudidiomarina marina TaxID=502366 RepID=A0A432YIN6_9GAMM|nr:cytochrome b/b6 domain-containing protein [Pseudidiomarina marina]RUO60814.1 cytochrome B [Pseudidiomarina marina]